MNKTNKYSAEDFKRDLEAGFTEKDIEAYEEGRTYAFPGSYTNEHVLLRENSLANILSHDVEGKRTAKEKALFKLCVIFSDQERFDDLKTAGLKNSAIAWAFKTTEENVEMKLLYDSAKSELLKKQKVKSY